jgi:hypothetical protein
MFVSLNFAWPVELQQLYAAMSVFNFNIQITAPEVRAGAAQPLVSPATASPCMAVAPVRCCAGDCQPPLPSRRLQALVFRSLPPHP